MDFIRHDIRYSVRTLLRSPVTTGVAILSLTLGIGANTAIFSLMNAVVLRPLPIPNPAQLVTLSTATPVNPEREESLSLAMIQQLRKDRRVFSSLFAWSGGGIDNVEADGVKYVASITTVSGEYFAALGIQPLLGRFIAPSDLNLDSGSPADVAVIDYGCWQHRYNGDPSVLGKTIRVDGHPLTIIGVTPESFSGLFIEASTDVVVPIGYDGTTDYRSRKSLGLNLGARLKPGVTLEQARAQVESLWPATLEASLPEGYSGAQRGAFLSRRIMVASGATGTSFLRRQYTRPLLVLMGMVGVLLLIACANLANLMLARAAGRSQEFGIRIALGAGRAHRPADAYRKPDTFGHWGSFGAADGQLGQSPAAAHDGERVRLLHARCGAGFAGSVLHLARVTCHRSPLWHRTGMESDTRRPCLRPATQRANGSRWFLKLANVLISAQVALSLVLLIGAVLFVAVSTTSARSTSGSGVTA